LEREQGKEDEPLEEVSLLLFFAVPTFPRCAGEKGSLDLEHDIVHALSDVVLTTCIGQKYWSALVERERRRGGGDEPKAI
jgi:hypothetical protein